MGLVTFKSKLLEDFAYHRLGVMIRQQFKSQESGSETNRGPLTTKELEESKVRWVKKVQAGMSMELQSSGWDIFGRRRVC